MQNTSFQNVITLLTDDQTPRVWSLLVTVFGELAQEKGARISGPLLSHLCNRMGIKPEAMRVALHRLRKDGWIESQRTGRTSTYFLTDWGRSQSVQASPRIYATQAAAKLAWMVVSNPGQPVDQEGKTGAWVTSNILLTSHKPEATNTFVTTLDPDRPLPNWMTSKVCDSETIAMSTRFAQALRTLQVHLDTSPPLAILEIAALRVLVVHSWRRIILKTPILPDQVFPEDWRGDTCRNMVGHLLTQYPKRGLDELEAAITAPT